MNNTQSELLEYYICLYTCYIFNKTMKQAVFKSTEIGFFSLYNVCQTVKFYIKVYWYIVFIYQLAKMIHFFKLPFPSVNKKTHLKKKKKKFIVIS